MPRRLLLLAVVATLQTPTLHAQQTPPRQEPDPIEAGMPAAPGDYDTGIDVLHYQLELGLGSDASWIGGRATLTVRAVRDVTELALDFSGLAVDTVAVDGAPVSGWTLDAGRLHVPLELGAGAQRPVLVTYRGVPDDGLDLGKDVHGDRTVFADNWPNRARFWFPSVDHPSDKATVRFIVHAPAAWSVVANGRRIGQPFPTAPGAPGPADGPRRTWIWSTDVPIPAYTMVVGAGPLTVTDLGTAACGRAPASPRTDGCVDITTWLFQPDVDKGNASFVRAPQMVDFFSDVVGPFPYEKLAHVQSATRFGGMENSSAIFYDQEALASGRSIEGTVSHETAHQWFGDAVTEGDWAHLWLSEGFATYFGALFFEYADGPAALDARMASAAQRYLSSPDTLRPVVDTEAANLFDLLNANSYQKGAWVLHMLRRLVGDEVFFHGIREYYARHRDGTALTEDLQDVMEEVSGADLDWFFHQWLYEPGYPVLALHKGSAADGSLAVTLREIQESYAPRFRLPVVLRLRWDGGERREQVELDGDSGHWEFQGVPPSAEVVVDPDHDLLVRVAR